MVAASPVPTATTPLKPRLVPQRRLPRFGFHTHCERLNAVSYTHLTLPTIYSV